jgi:hypothetical protein
MSSWCEGESEDRRTRVEDMRSKQPTFVGVSARYGAFLNGRAVSGYDALSTGSPEKWRRRVGSVAQGLPTRSDENGREQRSRCKLPGRRADVDCGVGHYTRTTSLGMGGPRGFWTAEGVMDNVYAAPVCQIHS